MKIEINSFIDKGIIKSERIALKATEDCNLKFYSIHLTYELSSGGFFNQPYKTYWFPPLEIKAGDWIVIYSGTGTLSTKKNEDGSTSYFHYWGLATAIFNKPEDSIVLAELNTWQMKNNK
jgi:hypothetical protein